MIKVTDLNYIYQQGMPFEKKALSDVSFEIPDGDFAALIGHTGSGKSTLIQHLNALVRPTSGKIEIDGTDITDPKTDLREIRKKVGLVFQYPEHQLFEESVYKDIAFGPVNMGLPEEEVRTRVYEAIALVGLDEALLEKSPFELSGGQKRRAAIAGVLTVTGCALCSPMLTLLGTPDDIFADSDIYLRVYVLGLLFLFIYNACNGIFTALGDSKTPLFFLIASSLGNIGLDLLFVIVFQMGVAGVAWATFAAQGAAGVAAFFVLLRRVGKIQSDTPEKPKIFSSDALKQISRISVPSILQSSFVSVGNLFVQSLVNSFGSSVIGGYASAIKLNTFAITCFSTLSNSVSSFCAQNIGANKTDRIKTGVKSGMLMCLVIAIPFVVCFLLFGGTLVNLFATQANAEIIATGSKFLTIVSPFYFFVCIKIVIDGGVRGCGVMTPFMISTCLDLALRVIFAYILSPFFGSDGIWLSWPVGWVLALVVDLFFYNYYIRKGKAFSL